MEDQQATADVSEESGAGSDDLQLELAAMSDVARELGALSPDARRRVWQWAAERFGIASSVSPAGPRAPQVAHRDPDSGSSGGGADREFGSLAELFDAAQPNQQDQKALVAAYWLQTEQGSQTLTGLAINSELRQLGQEVKIAMAMSALQVRKPALVLQLRKSGKTQQARKLYKVTEAGLRAVRAAMDNGGFSDW